MKIILEYRKEGSHWTSLSTGIQMQSTRNEAYYRIFGGIWIDHTKIGDSYWRNVDYPHKYSLLEHECPQTISYATLTNLFKATTVAETEDGIPISSREWNVRYSDVALLTIEEYETCLQGVENIIEYKAILAAAKSIQEQNYEARFFIFKY